VATLGALIPGLLALAPRAVLAHPMGNFSISHFAGLRIEAGWIEVRYILDLAEIPTFQEMQDTGIVPKVDDPRVAAYLHAKAEALKSGLRVALNGVPLQLETQSENVIFPPGAGNLPTMKIGVVYRARLEPQTGPCSIEYRDSNFPERAGWKEVVAEAAPGVTVLASTVPAAPRSQELANYPTNLINSPPQDLSARLTFALAAPVAARSRGHGRVASSSAEKGLEGSGRAPAGKPLAPSVATEKTAPAAPAVAPAEPVALAANRQGTPRNRFTEIIASPRWGLWFLFTAALVAAALGGLHALEPGHGKTIVAAYLVGSQGTATHALLLGLVVTATHTAGVYALGLVTLYASKYIVPERLYPWLGIASGITIALLGLYMLRRRSLGHGHDHEHPHHPHEHPHHPHEHHPHHHGPGGAHEHPSALSCRQLVALGVTGGIVPCPAALVVLLSAISQHRVAFGLYLIVAFSLGLAAILISIGMVTVYARRLLARLPSEGPLVNRWLPMASASVITCLGVGLVIQGLVAAGMFPARW
jgi:ABC-type nickel/cobalt efflux system permease component RcnA